MDIKYDDNKIMSKVYFQNSSSDSDDSGYLWYKNEI